MASAYNVINPCVMRRSVPFGALMVILLKMIDYDVDIIHAAGTNVILSDGVPNMGTFAGITSSISSCPP